MHWKERRDQGEENMTEIWYSTCTTDWRVTARHVAMTSKEQEAILQPRRERCVMFVQGEHLQ